MRVASRGEREGSSVVASDSTFAKITETSMNHLQPSQQSPLRQNGSKRGAPCDRRGKPAAPHCAQQQPRIEIPLTLACIAVTLAGWLGATWETGSLLVQQYAGNETRGWMEEAIFIVVTQVLIYGSLVYQFTRYGFLRR